MEKEHTLSHAGHSFGRTVCAFLSGAVVGAATGFLTAPCSGTEMRDRVGKWANRGRKQLSRISPALKDASEAAKQAFNEKITDSSSRTASGSDRERSDRPKNSESQPRSLASH